ncbi:Na(+)/H(+) exchanger protein 2-like isoform X2 [Neocloeon triangulifer]|uniref:Na(+)/H(+) exchanger protein 2-like isoform X2 n=1 Tax=Neocloeon triangulifer TaxID=2078957 RepID=UPI00286ED666|nr:Na(+)/H(+) exchanger protein 2-like isoform X2 [Neocloeon triangulifer]
MRALVVALLAFGAVGAAGLAANNVHLNQNLASQRGFDLVEDNTAASTTTEKPPKEHQVHRYPVASVEFARVETPFIIGLWIFCASLAKIGFHMAPKLSKMFPESCLLIVVGVVIGVLLISTSSVHVSPLTPDTFFLYMLPPIILDAGYFMPNRLFFDHLGTILLFAVVGTIFNVITIGMSLWAVGQSGLFEFETPVLDMMLFGSLISAVDPVAVLAVFEEIHVNEILYIVVFGESLLNDAVTVVLYHMFEAYSEMGPANIVPTDVLSGIASFFVVAFGGTVIGIIWGFLTGFVTRFTHQVRVIEPIFIFVMAYLAYLNAEIFHMSGILAITFCGITMKNYVEANISHKSHTTVKYAMKMLSSSSETVIFMFLGVATVNNTHSWNTWFVLLTVLFCSVYRFIGVMILASIANKFRLHQLNGVEKFVMSYGGLRGAVAFALVLLIDPKIVKLQPLFVTTTIAVIYFTVFFQGITIKPLVRILNVKRAEKRKPTMNERIHERLMDHIMAGLEDVLGRHGNHHVRDRFKRFDTKYIRPWLIRDNKGAEPKILETYSKLTMKEAMEYMRRNASTLAAFPGTESMSTLFRNCTQTNMDASFSFTQLDSSVQNLDMQELEYNPSKKDLTDAKIHHLLSEELCKPRRHRRLSYSRHAVNDRDLSTQEVNYKMHMNMRHIISGKHHHKRSKKLNKEGKPHVSFPGITQNGSVKQFTHDYINEMLEESDSNEPDEARPSTSGLNDGPEGGIVFTAKSTPTNTGPASNSNLLTVHPAQTHQQPRPPWHLPLKQTTSCSSTNPVSPQPNHNNDQPTVAEASLPWRRSQHVTDEAVVHNEDPHPKDPGKRASRTDSEEEAVHVTPTATETVLPWKRDDEAEQCTFPLRQHEFPGWCSNKEYLAYNSPSSTFLGGLDQPKVASVIGLFRRESTVDQEMARADAAILVIEECPASPVPSSATPSGTPGMPKRPSSARRGSLLELGASVDPIPEEEAGTPESSANKSPPWAQRRRRKQGACSSSYEDFRSNV